MTNNSMVQLVLTRVIDESATIRTFCFIPERALDHQAGQFIELHLPHPNADKKGVHRWFTLSSSPTEHEVSITADRPLEPTITSTFKQALWRLQPGDTAQASGPLGDFVLPLDNTTPLVWIAGGIGITPFRSLAAWIADNQETRHIQLIHSTSSDDERIFTEQFQRASLAGFHHVDTSQRPRLNAQSVLEAIQAPTATSAIFYIAGPEPMVDSLAHDLRGHGVARGRIVTDAFLDYY